MTNTEIPSLNQIYFYLTEGCNLACRHCWLAPMYDPEGTQYPTLDVELFDTAIREAMPLGLERVKLTGGEPLLHPQFLELLEIVRREDLGLALETNGLLCTPKVAAELARFDERNVSVSIDGADAETHDWVRGREGSFELAERAVTNLVEAGIAPQIIMTLLPENAHQIDLIILLGERLGAASVKINVLQPTARGEKIHESGASLDVSEILELQRYVEVTNARTTKIKIHFDVPPAFMPLSQIGGPGGVGMCGIKNILGVIASGQYALCGIGEHLPDLVFGRVKTDDLEKIWKENETLNLLRAGLPDKLKGVCGRCIMKHICLGECVAQNVYRSGRLWEPFWFCEQAMEKSLFPETRLLPEPLVVAETMVG